MRILLLSFLLNLTFTASFSAYGAYQCAGLFSDQSSVIYETSKKLQDRLILRQYGKSYDDKNNAATQQQEFRTAGGSTGGRWIKNAEGNSWFRKTDVLHPELQTSAEVISAYIYRAMGYNVPVTHKLKIEDRYYSFSKDIGANTKSSNLDNFKAPKDRILRVVAAYLKDWDRLGNPENNRVLPDGSLVLIDFGGTLGSRARGEFKPGPVVSEAIGAFDSGSQKDIYRSFMVNADQNHPWMKLTKQDLAMAIVLFEKLTNSYLYDAVSAANYSSAKDAQYMFETLKTRRDNLIAELKEML